MKDQKKILIVGVPCSEENLYRQALSTFDISFISDANQALEELKKQGPHLLLLDHRLPNIDVIDFIKQVSLIRNLPIILLLESGQEKLAVSAVKEGISDYITRDELIPAILGMAVNRAMEQHRWKQIYQNMTGKTPELILKDSITGLFNRSYFETRLKEETTRAQRYEFPLTMATFQVESFAQMNQRFGSAGMNQLLKELGQLLLKNLRSSDLLAKLDANKFALLLPHTTATQARTAWTRILSQVAAHPFSVGGQNVFINVRGVLMALNNQARDMESLLSDMEKALSQMKTDDETTLILYLPD